MSDEVHRYGDLRGEARLLEQLQNKLQTTNGIDMTGRQVMVTHGANQVNHTDTTGRQFMVPHGIDMTGLPQRADGDLRSQ